MESIVKTDKQLYFNQVKGIVTELNDGERFCSITILVGHENTRFVNLAIKKQDFDRFIESLKIKKGMRVNIRFYLSCNKKNDRWYTSANILQIDVAGDEGI